MRRLVVAGLGAVAATLTLTATAAAQERVRTHVIELTMGAGMWSPMGGKAGQLGTVDLTRRPGWLANSHLSFNAAPSGMFSVDFSAGYGAERIRQSTGGVVAGTRRTNVFYGTGKLMLGRSPRKPGVSYMVGGGFGMVHRKKSVLDAAKKTTDVGGSLGAMVRIPVDGQSGVRFDAEGLFYSADYGLGKKMRSDLVATVGLSIAW